MGEINYIEQYGNKREQQGIQQGIQQGRRREKIEIAKELLKYNYTITEVAEIIELPIEKIEEIGRSLSTC